MVTSSLLSWPEITTSLVSMSRREIIPVSWFTRQNGFSHSRLFLSLTGVRPLLNVLQKAGGWPVLEGNAWTGENSFKWWEWIYSMNNIGLGINGLITFTMGSDDKNSSWRVLGFDQASLGTSREYLVEGFDNQNVQHYFNYMVKSAILLGASEETAKAELKESLLFEIALANISKPKNERRNADSLYNPTTLEELPKYDGFPPSWTNFVQTILNETEDTNVIGSDRVIVTSLEYFKDLSNLINATKHRVIANHLGWQAVRSAMSSLNLEALKIKEAYDKAISGVEKTSPMWKRCVSTVGFGNTAGSFSLGILASSMYIKKFFKPEAKEATLEMTSYLRYGVPFKDLICRVKNNFIK
jgi:membrane metallo-endopeptidase-like protein 1